MPIEATHHFYHALTLTALYPVATSAQQAKYRRILGDKLKKLQFWADNCPENYRNRQALVLAEIARIERRNFDAMRLYEDAIQSARQNGFIQNEAVAYELAARFYTTSGFETIAQTYIRNARYCYLRWGALGKVRQIDQQYPLLKEDRTPSAVATIETPVEHLDLGMVMRVSQAVSGEILLEQLVQKLMVIVVEHAGAERGLLILPYGEAHRIAAEARTGRDGVEVQLRQAPVTRSDLPDSLLRYVIRTQESVILDDASVQNLFSEDEYIRQQRPRSILCLPLVKQARLKGVLYLENNLAPRVFTTERLSVLELIASQAAISLDHARLYADLLQENNDRRKAEEALRASEERWSMLAENSSAGIALIAPDGRFIAANLALQDMLGYTEAELKERTISSISHAEDRADTEARLAHAYTGQRRVYRVEKRYLRKDCTLMWADVSSVFVPSTAGNSGFFTVVIIDITKRKRAEMSLREAQNELAHVSRVTTMGELTASIAHEVNQPLAGMVTNAHASLRWLAGDSPNLTEAREAIRRVIRDGNRAGDVISRMRALFKKAHAAKEPVDINELIQEVLTLTQTELQKNRVSLRTEFAKDLPRAIGDRIQLQQVILNLVINAIEAMTGIAEGPRELWVSSKQVSASPAPANKYTMESNVLTQPESGAVLITVGDSGPGLDPTELKRVFETFYTTKPHGLGMGLAISRSIIEAHGGRLQAMANAPRGAVFQFMLPISDPKIS
jgi:PAS domain S-box-containing protein